MTEKIIAIGDIHGCCKSVDSLLDKLDAYPQHKLLFVGDYIDRGPCSSDVISRMLELNKKRDCIFLRGNHEQMLLDGLDQGDLTLWLHNGGSATLASYGSGRDRPDLPSSHLEFIRNTILWYETQNYFFVHAGLSAGRTIRDSLDDPESVHEFLWNRDHLNAVETAWEKVVVFGHTPCPGVFRRPGMIGIDTGCVYSAPGMGRLSALVLPEDLIVQQPSLD